MSRIGQELPYEVLPRIVAWRRNSGFSITKRYPVDADNLDALGATLRASAGVLSVEPVPIGGTLWELRATYGAAEGASGTDLYAETWDFDVIDEQLDLWRLPEVKTELRKLNVRYQGALATDAYRKLHNLVDGIVGGLTETSEANLLPPGTSVDQTNGNAVLDTAEVLVYIGDVLGLNSAVFAGLMEKLCRGEDAKLIDRVVLRRTRIWNTGGIPPAEGTNIGKMLNRQTLIGEGVPDVTAVRLPQDGAWLKKRSPFRVQSDGRGQEVTEWWHFDEWDHDLYGEAI